MVVSFFTQIKVCSEEIAECSMSFLRFLMLLSLVAWVGGITFFAFILAPTAFVVLPSFHIAGAIVGATLAKLHWMGIICGAAFLACSFSLEWAMTRRLAIFAANNILFYLMLALTCISQFVVIPRMETLRMSVSNIESLALSNPVRIHFDKLHALSVRLESFVLILGVAVIYLTSRGLMSRRTVRARLSYEA
jgi:uncharacterized membrane protein